MNKLVNLMLRKERGKATFAGSLGSTQMLSALDVSAWLSSGYDP